VGLRQQAPASGKYNPLALTPGKTGRLPASNGAAVPIVVERPFETVRDVMTGSIARLCHRLGRSKAPASRTANEEEIVIQLSAKRFKLAGETLRKARIHGLIRKGLPFDEDSPLAYGSEIRNPDISPLRACADVNQLGARTRDEALPSRLNINSVDRFIAVRHAQITIPSWLRLTFVLQPWAYQPTRELKMYSAEVSGPTNINI
jgi:hypothetical protein